jgi:hypothetical protein
MKKYAAGFCVALLVGVAAAPAESQVFTPSFMSPQPGGDVGIYINEGPGDFSIEGVWRRNLGGYDLGFRGGIADRRDAVILLGAELRAPVDIADAPILAAITGGVQGAIGDGGAAGFQFGLTVGFPWSPDNFTLVPYLHPRLGLVSGFGRDDLELEVLADIGFDFILPQNIIFRIGFGLGDPTADWGMGFAWR